MLTIKQNFLETIHGGTPDRFVKQYEYLEMMVDPIFLGTVGFCPQGGEGQNGWGVKIKFPEGVPGPFPCCEGEDKLIKDVTQWKEVLKAPPTKYPEEAWAAFVEQANKIDRNEKFAAAMIVNGIFEKLHYFMGMEDTMINFYEEPEAMHELIDFLADWEIECAKETIAHLHPDALFHHDDWGSQRSTFLSPEMFDEFILPAYKKIYGFWKENGVELIVHHSDSYAATLVPEMIEMGIDVFQGAVDDNNIPEILKKYGGKISVHGGVNNGKVDTSDWTEEAVYAETKRMCDACGKLYFIPGLTAGGPGSTYPGVYEAVDKALDQLSKEIF